MCSLINTYTQGGGGGCKTLEGYDVEIVEREFYLVAFCRRFS